MDLGWSSWELVRWNTNIHNIPVACLRVLVFWAHHLNKKNERSFKYQTEVKWKLLSLVQLCDPMHCSPWTSPDQNTGVGPFPSPRDLPTPGIEPRSPTLQVDSLPAEPQGKPQIAILYVKNIFRLRHYLFF